MASMATCLARIWGLALRVWYRSELQELNAVTNMQSGAVTAVCWGSLISALRMAHRSRVARHSTSKRRHGNVPYQTRVSKEGQHAVSYQTSPFSVEKAPIRMSDKASLVVHLCMRRVLHSQICQRGASFVGYHAAHIAASQVLQMAPCAPSALGQAPVRQSITIPL